MAGNGHRMKKDTPHRMAENLLCKYMDHVERDVQLGRMLPLKAVDRIALEIALTWVCERYDITPKWIAQKQRSDEKKHKKAMALVEDGDERKMA